MHPLHFYTIHDRGVPICNTPSSHCLPFYPWLLWLSVWLSVPPPCPAPFRSLQCSLGRPETHKMKDAPLWNAELHFKRQGSANQSAYLWSPVPELSQNLCPVIWDDAQRVLSEGELLQTRQHPNVFNLFKLGTKKQKLHSVRIGGSSFVRKQLSS